MNTDFMTGLILAGIAVNFIGMLIIGIRVEARGARTDKFEGRIAVLEEQRKNAVSHADLAAIRDRLSELSGQMIGVASRLDASATMISTIQKHLMDVE